MRTSGQRTMMPPTLRAGRAGPQAAAAWLTMAFPATTTGAAIMDMPKPGPEHDRLARFAGEWQGDEELQPSPWGPGGPAQGHGVYRMINDGMALTQDYAETKDGAVVFHGHGVFSIDPENGDVVWWWFDSMGFPPDGPARGRWDGDTLTLLKATPRGEGRYVYALQGDSYTFSIENRFPGQDEFCLFMRGHYQRKA
jgi:Protein of unknown function (DUF1579)